MMFNESAYTSDLNRVGGGCLCVFVFVREHQVTFKKQTRTF